MTEDIEKFLGRLRKPQPPKQWGKGDDPTFGRFSYGNKIQQKINSAQSLDDLFATLQELSTDKKATAAWDKSSTGSFSLSDQVREMSEYDLPGKIDYTANALLQSGTDSEDVADVLDMQFGRTFTRTFGVRDKAKQLIPLKVREIELKRNRDAYLNEEQSSEPQGEAEPQQEYDMMTYEEAGEFMGLPEPIEDATPDMEGYDPWKPPEFQPNVKRPASEDEPLDAAPPDRTPELSDWQKGQAELPLPSGFESLMSPEEAKEYQAKLNRQKTPQPEEEYRMVGDDPTWEDPFLQGTYKAWFREVMKP